MLYRGAAQATMTSQLTSFTILVVAYLRVGVSKAGAVFVQKLAPEKPNPLLHAPSLDKLPISAKLEKRSKIFSTAPLSKHHQDLDLYTSTSGYQSRLQNPKVSLLSSWANNPIYMPSMMLIHSPSHYVRIYSSVRAQVSIAMERSGLRSPADPFQIRSQRHYLRRAMATPKIP